MPQDSGDHILNGLCHLWIEKIRRAKDHKKKMFQDDADEAMRFFRPPEGNYNFVYRGDIEGSKGIGIDVKEPSMKMTINKVAEVVQIFGPFLYAKNPVRQVNVRQNIPVVPMIMNDPAILQSVLPQDPQTAALMQDPMMQQAIAQIIGQQESQRQNVNAIISQLVAAYLNYTPNELGLKNHAEQAIDEALIKGRGCLWTKMYTPPESQMRMVGSFYDSVDFLQVDPDAECFDKAWWIARECTHPYWEVEKTYGLEPGSLKNRAQFESVNMQSEIDSSGRYFDRQRGQTNDLMTYWEIYSKMGSGGRLSGSGIKELNADMLPGDLQSFARVLDPIVGDYCYLVVANGVEYPLNLPPQIQALPVTGDGSPQDGAVEIKNRMSWPIPFWQDDHWPVSVLDFHVVPRSPWPMSHVKPALGELRFLCWAYSFVCGKIKNTLRDVVAILKEMSEEFKLTIAEGVDLSIAELDTTNRDVRECVQVLQFPQMNSDIWRIIAAVEENFDKRVGLNEMMYGNVQRSDRSAAESQIKAQHANIRPDDMAERVEGWMTEVARKEALGARMNLGFNDVTPVIGNTASILWQQFVTAKDINVMRELEYRIEAGSARKPNRDRDQANADQAMQILLPILNQVASATGQVDPLNALIGFWAKTRDLDASAFLIHPQPPPPPMPPPPPEGKAGGAPSGNGHKPAAQKVA